MDNSAETYLFLNGLDFTEMATGSAHVGRDTALCLSANRPRADVTDIIESEYETKEWIFGEHEVASRLSYAFGKITLLTKGVTDSRTLRASLDEFCPEARDLYSFMDFEGFQVEGGAPPLARFRRCPSH